MTDLELQEKLGEFTLAKHEYLTPASEQRILAAACSQSFQYREG